MVSNRKKTSVYLMMPLGLLLALSLVTSQSNATTDIEAYVKKPDNYFAYSLASEMNANGVTLKNYRLQSQAWRQPHEVDRAVWEHRLSLALPASITSDTAIIFVNSGHNGPGYLNPGSFMLNTGVAFAALTGTLVAEINQVPNQPLVFADEPGLAYTEDELVSYTWDTAMGTGDYSWSAYSPMVKSVTKAMDAVQALAVSDPAIPAITNFVVAGFSKRGVTAWLTAALDERVIAVAPGVFDILNMPESIENQARTYGTYPDSLEDYRERNALNRMRTPEGRRLLREIDPVNFVQQLKMPKFIINVSGDEFFPPDSSLFYIDKFKGETLLRYVPNTNHGGKNGGFDTVMYSLLAWYQAILSDTPRAGFDWQFVDKNQLQIKINPKISKAYLWTAHNKAHRDFRYLSVGPIYQSSEVITDSEGNAQVMLDSPSSGWKAQFVEVISANSSGLEEKYSTPVFILPDRFEHELIEPVNQPMNKAFWLERLAAIIDGSIKDEALLRSFPIRAVADVSILDVKAAYHQLWLAADTQQEKAVQECLVLRLNIKQQQLGWYSRPASVDNAPVWQAWSLSDLFYRSGLPRLSEKICGRLNTSRMF